MWTTLIRTPIYYVGDSPENMLLVAYRSKILASIDFHMAITNHFDLIIEGA
jgi:hypothetical protein